MASRARVAAAAVTTTVLSQSALALDSLLGYEHSARWNEARGLSFHRQRPEHEAGLP